MIRRSGENIGAREVESVCGSHPGQRARCAAVPDDVRGEEVLACIVPREPVGDLIEAAADIVAHTLRELAYFKAPGCVAFVDSLPLTATHKVQRGELKALAHASFRLRLLDTRRAETAAMGDYAGVVVLLPGHRSLMCRRSDKASGLKLGRRPCAADRGEWPAKPEIRWAVRVQLHAGAGWPRVVLHYVRLSPRFLEFLPVGGACGVIAWRCARACRMATPTSSPASPATPTDRNSFRDLVANFSSFSRDFGLSLWRRWSEREFCHLTADADARDGRRRGRISSKLALRSGEWRNAIRSRCCAIV